MLYKDYIKVNKYKKNMIIFSHILKNIITMIINILKNLKKSYLKILKMKKIQIVKKIKQKFKKKKVFLMIKKSININHFPPRKDLKTPYQCHHKDN